MPTRRYDPAIRTAPRNRSSDASDRGTLNPGRRSHSILLIGIPIALAALLLPPGQAIAMACMGGISVAFLTLMARSWWPMPTIPRRIWASLWTAQALFLIAGQAYVAVVSSETNQPLPVWIAVVFNSAYLPAFIGLAWIIRLNPELGIGTWVDAGIVTAGAAAVVVSLALKSVAAGPQVAQSDPPFLIPALRLLGHPVLDLALVALVAVLLVVGRWRRPVYLLILVSFGCALAADLTVNLDLNRQDEVTSWRIFQVLLIAGLVFMTSASVAADSGSIATPDTSVPVEYNPARAVLVSGALLLVPMALLAAVWTANVDHARLLSVLTLVIVALGLWRGLLLVKAIRAERQFLGDIVETAGEGIVRLDIQGCTLFANTEARRILRCRETDLAGQNFHDQCHYRHADGSAFPWTDCQSHKVITGLTSNVRGMTAFFRRDGSMFPVEVTTTPVTYEGEITGAILTFRDITERVALDEAKSQFVALVSHELRTPLTAIKGNLRLLEGGVVGPLSDRQQDLVGSAVANASRLEWLVNDLLDMERLDDGKLPLHPERVSASDLARRAVSGIQDVAAAASIPLSLELAAAVDNAWVSSIRTAWCRY